MRPLATQANAVPRTIGNHSSKMLIVTEFSLIEFEIQTTKSYRMKTKLQPLYGGVRQALVFTIFHIAPTWRK